MTCFFREPKRLQNLEGGSHTPYCFAMAHLIGMWLPQRLAGIFLSLSPRLKAERPGARGGLHLQPPKIISYSFGQKEHSLNQALPVAHGSQLPVTISCPACQPPVLPVFHGAARCPQLASFPMFCQLSASQEGAQNPLDNGDSKKARLSAARWLPLGCPCLARCP